MENVSDNWGVWERRSRFHGDFGSASNIGSRSLA